MTLHDTRTALAAAVTAGGIECLPYPSDNLNPPIAFVDDLQVAFSDGGFGQTFCLPGSVGATIVSISQRHDREGATQFLEGLLPGMLDALHAIQGVRVVSASSGSLSLGGQDLPALTVAVQFQV